MTPSAVRFVHHHADDPTVVDDLVEVYLQVHEPERANDAFYGEDRFRRQVTSHMASPGWEAVIAEADGDKVGFAYGLALAPGTHWWDGLVTDVDQGFTQETGTRTFALSELMVREDWRRRGIAHALHDELLAGRREDRATLLVRPDNSAAQDAYKRWGWSKAAELQPAWENAPRYDVLMLPLPVARI